MFVHCHQSAESNLLRHALGWREGVAELLLRSKEDLRLRNRPIEPVTACSSGRNDMAVSGCSRIETDVFPHRRRNPD